MSKTRARKCHEYYHVGPLRNSRTKHQKSKQVDQTRLGVFSSTVADQQGSCSSLLKKGLPGGGLWKVRHLPQLFFRAACNCLAQLEHATAPDGQIYWVARPEPFLCHAVSLQRHGPIHPASPSKRKETTPFALHWLPTQSTTTASISMTTNCYQQQS